MEDQQTLVTFKRRRRSVEFTSPAKFAKPDTSHATPPPIASTVASNVSKSINLSKKSSRQLVQVHLDLGQKNFHSIQCPVCGLIYAPGKPADDRLHASYHNKNVSIKYIAAPSDIIVATDGSNGDIIKLGGGSAQPSKSMKEVATTLEVDLGLVQGWLLSNKESTIFLYVDRKTKIILGCIVAENIEHAWKAVDSSSSPVPSLSPSRHQGRLTSTERKDSGQRPSSTNGNAMMVKGKGEKDVRGSGIVLANKEEVQKKVRHGVRMLWTSVHARRKKVATKLLDCARCQLVRGYVIPKDKIAFSQPTTDGSAFIQAYSASKQFLIYDATNM